MQEIPEALADSAGFSLQARRSFALFLEYTTAHGLGRLRSQASILGRLIWLFFLIMTYSGLIYHGFTLFERFVSWPVLTSVTANVPFEFPDVYICPADPVTMSKVVSKIEEESILKPASSIYCTGDCEREAYLLDTSGAKWQLNSFSSALLELENRVEESFAVLHRTKNFSDCRVSKSGVEYQGNASAAQVARLGYLVTLPIDANFTAFKQRSIISRPCIPWNDAAEILNSSHGEFKELAERILRLNYSKDESRCRSPAGLALSKLPRQNELSEYSTHTAYYLVTHPLEAFEAKCLLDDEPATTGGCARCCFEHRFTHAGVVHMRNSIRPACYCTDSTLNILAQGRGPGVNKLPIELITVKTGNQLLHLHSGSRLSSDLTGPYCFYQDEVYGLSASYCDIPYCAAAVEYDCIATSGDPIKRAVQLQQYTGHAQTSADGKLCMPWKQAQKLIRRTLPKDYVSPMDYDCVVSAENKPDQRGRRPPMALNIQNKTFNGQKCLSKNLTDELLKRSSNIVDIISADGAASQPGNNYCRSTQINTVSPIDLSIDTDMLQTPHCFPDDAESLSTMNSLPCDIQECRDAYPTVTGLIRDRIGSQVLARQLGSSLDISLIGCSFGRKTCSIEDFITFWHPQLGVCHKFLGKHLSQNMSLSQLAETQLMIKYFTDATDTYGKKLGSMESIRGILQPIGDSGRREERMALKVVVVPPGAFPWPSQVISVAPGQHMDVKLRLDKFKRLPAPTRPCRPSYPPVGYRLSTFQAASDDTHDNLAGPAIGDWGSPSGIFNQLEQLRRLFLAGESSRSPADLEFPLSGREGCLNEFIVQKFFANCHCLPAFLPIPVYMASHSYCFNLTDPVELLRRDKCYSAQVSMLQQYQSEAIKSCELPCESSEYSIRQVPYQWPKLQRQNSLKFVSDLAKGYGYPHRKRSARGVASIYHTFLTLQKDSDPKEIPQLETELYALENKLAMLTVQAWAPYGQEIAEEPAYPMKNLLADIGGALGLWCGISTLTLCELVELLIRIGSAVTCVRQRPGLRQKLKRSSDRIGQGSDKECAEML